MVAEGSLIHPIYEINAVGNHVTVNNGGSGNGFVTPLGDFGQSIWLGFLYQYVPGGVFGEFNMLFWDESTSAWAVNILLFDGYPSMESYYTGEEQTADVANPEAVMWIVIKAETSGSPDTTEMVYMWVDPVPGSEPDAANADIALEYNIPGGVTANHIQLIGLGDPIGYRIDEIRIGTQFSDVFTDLIIGLIGSARNAYPGNGVDGIDASTGSITLTWENGYDPDSAPENPVVRDDVASYTLYFGTNPNVGDNPSKSVAVVDQAGSSTESIDYETTYYWRVDQVLDDDDATIVEGYPWRFKTGLEPPTLLDNVIEAIEEAMVQKAVALEAVGTALAEEQNASATLDEMLDTGDYCGLTQQDIAKAIKRLEISIDRQQKVISDIEDSVFWLEKMLTFLTVEE